MEMSSKVRAVPLERWWRIGDLEEKSGEWKPRWKPGGNNGIYWNYVEDGTRAIDRGRRASPLPINFLDISVVMVDIKNSIDQSVESIDLGVHKFSEK